MPTVDRAMQARRRLRAIELLKQGCNTRQVAERTGITTRSALRFKKELEAGKVGGDDSCIMRA